MLRLKKAQTNKAITRTDQLIKTAIVLIGCVFFIFIDSGCDKNSSSPPWPEPKTDIPYIAEEEATTTSTVLPDNRSVWRPYNRSVWEFAKSRPPQWETTAPEQILYTIFPWPPPKPSSICEIPHNLLKAEPFEIRNLFDVLNKLRKVLDAAGYDNKSFHPIPDGFAIVTQLERYDEDGSKISDVTQSCLTHDPNRELSLRLLLENLFNANPGHYRIFVFIVTPNDFVPTTATLTKEEGQEWVTRGNRKLPWVIGHRPFTDEYMCLVYVYEFIKQNPESEPIFTEDSSLTARKHLIMSKIWAAF